MKLSNSKVNTYNRCKKRYEFSYVLRLKKRAKVVHLVRGTWLHTLLEVYYCGDATKKIEPRPGTKVRVGTNWLKAHRALTREFNNLFEEERDELGDLPGECERIMRSYIDRYAEEEAKNETLAVELDEWVTLPNGDEFNFIIDRVLRRPDGTVWLRDYKTVGSFLPDGFMLLDSQLARYFWAFKKLPAWAPYAKHLRGVEFDELRTKPPTIPEIVYAGTPREGLTTRANLDTDYHTYLKAIRDHKLKISDYKGVLTKLQTEPERFFRRTILTKDQPVVRQMMVDLMVTSADIKRHEKSGHFPRTTLKSCQWDCDFVELCTVDLHGGDIKPIVDLKFETKERP